MAILGVVLVVLQRYTSAKALHRIYYNCEPSQNLVEPGETFTLTTTVENQKNMMVPFVRMLEQFDPDIQLHIKADEIFYGAKDTELTSRFYMMPNQVYTREMEANFRSRGCYHLRPAILYGGDYLGLEEHEEYFPVRQEVVVMPESLDCPLLDQTLGDYLGDMSVNRFILEDPMLTVGFSEYTGREPMRAISWKQTSRLNKMMVKNYDHTLDMAVSILLNVEVTMLTEESNARIEDCYRIVRTICETLEKNRIQYNFYTNASIAGFAGTWSNIGSGLGDTHFAYVMEGLGRAVNYANYEFSSLLNKVTYQAERSNSFIVVTPYEEECWQPQLRRLKQSAWGSVCVLTPDVLGEDASYKADEEVSA